MPFLILGFVALLIFIYAVASVKYFDKMHFKENEKDKDVFI